MRQTCNSRNEKPRQGPDQTRRRGGFSLLELLLTLALSVMLMAMVGTAFSFYATRLEVRNTEVRRVQLAQSILNMIGDDLRCAIRPPEFDDAALKQFLTSASGGAAAPGEGQDLSAAGLDDLSEPEDEGLGTPAEGSELASAETMESVDLGVGTAATMRPGLMGNQTQIQFDVSRLPRLEEYQPTLVGDTPAEMTDVPSDIKTVTYYIQGPAGAVMDPLALPAAEGTTAGTATSTGGGLVRRSLDRAITQWAMQNGGTVALGATGDLIATEVVAIEFQYWDGLMWQMFWDSDAQGALPQAVRVTLTMLEPQSEAPDADTSVLNTRVYAQIVRLPMALQPPAESTTDLSAAGL